MLPEGLVAFRWLNERYSIALELVPAELRGRLEEAEIYHEILEHNWYLNERSTDEVLLEDATRDYVEQILNTHADERTILDARELDDDSDVTDEDDAAEVADYAMVSPPDTDSVWPVVKPASSDAK